MEITIDSKICERYPDVQIGYLVAQGDVQKTDPFVEKLKANLRQNLMDNADFSVWQKIYEEDFGVKPKIYRSSVEALYRRVHAGKSLWNICNVVDLYNCTSLMTLLPMGGYDVAKIKGDIQIRYAYPGEMFLSLGETEPLETKPNHVVYADENKVLCWLWNHKDSAESCIDTGSKRILFFMDGFDHQSVQNALHLLENHLKEIQCVTIESGILNKCRPGTRVA